MAVKTTSQDVNGEFDNITYRHTHKRGYELKLNQTLKWEVQTPTVYDSMRLLYSATSSSVSATIMTLWILSRLNNERRTWYLGYYGLLLAGVRERCKKTKQKETDNVSFKYACEAKITEDLAFIIGYEWRNKSKMLLFIIVYECVKSKLTSFLLFLRTFPLWVYKIPFEGTGLI